MWDNDIDVSRDCYSIAFLIVSGSLHASFGASRYRAGCNSWGGRASC